MANKYLARVGGKNQQVSSISQSAGAADAGKIVALGDGGKIDDSMMPEGIGASVNVLVASEALGAGNFVNIHAEGGVAKVRKADNASGRPADGFVLEAVASAENASVYPLDGINAGLTSLTPGSGYWLGVAGGVVDTPLDPTIVGNANKICQYLGKAKSDTELITEDDGFVVL